MAQAAELAIPGAMDDMHAFFHLHRDLPREGPGCRDDLDRALAFAEIPRGARVLDAGCGPGADVEGLLAHAPEGSVLAVDPHLPFVEQVRARYAGDRRVRAEAIGMEDAVGPFDLVWCAGALYFLGLDAGLPVLRSKLGPGGVLAFSHPCWFVEAPSEDALAFWQGEGVSLSDTAGVLGAVAAAGFEVLGSFPVSDASWEAYYGPLEARIEALSPTADDALQGALEEGRQEAAGWRRVKRETGYLQVVARRA